MRRTHRPRHTPAPSRPDGYRRWGVALLAAAAVAAGCGDREPDAAPSLTREEFIDLVVAIRETEFQVEDQDSAHVRFRSLRDSILEARGATEAELYEFLEYHSDLDYMDEVWDTITERLKRPLQEQHEVAEPRRPSRRSGLDSPRSRARPPAGPDSAGPGGL